MSVPSFTQPDSTGTRPGLGLVPKDERERLSGPGLREFRSIADHLELSERDRLVLLGQPSRSAYHAWLGKADRAEPFALSVDQLMRISAVLGVWKALGIVFVRDHEARAWLRSPHRSTVFGGRPPLEVMLDGSQDSILRVRRYLDAWRGGLPGGGSVEYEPVTREDIIFA